MVMLMIEKIHGITSLLVIVKIDNISLKDFIFFHFSSELFYTKFLSFLFNDFMESAWPKLF